MDTTFKMDIDFWINIGFKTTGTKIDGHNLRTPVVSATPKGVSTEL
jgi:hypothetical protein